MRMKIFQRRAVPRTVKKVNHLGCLTDLKLGVPSHFWSKLENFLILQNLFADLFCGNSSDNIFIPPWVSRRKEKRLLLGGFRMKTNCGFAFYPLNREMLTAETKEKSFLTVWWCLFPFCALTGVWKNLFPVFSLLGNWGKTFQTVLQIFEWFLQPSLSLLLYTSTFLRHLGFSVIVGVNWGTRWKFRQDNFSTFRSGLHIVNRFWRLKTIASLGADYTLSTEFVFLWILIQHPCNLYLTTQSKMRRNSDTRVR